MPRVSWGLLLAPGLFAIACLPEPSDDHGLPPPLVGSVAGGPGGFQFPDEGVTSTRTCGAGSAGQGVVGPLMATPLLGPTQSADVPPPPISGGTLIATRDGQLLVAADPDRDQLYFVDSASFTLLHVQKLAEGDEPARLVEDGAGRIHVALRGGRGIATLTREADSAIMRREVCQLPRGLAYDSARDVLQVACAEGKLVSMPAGSGVPLRTLDIGRDARDVIVRGSETFVTHFRAAELVAIAGDGTLSAARVPPTFSAFENTFVMDPSMPACGSFQETIVANTPTVAWRTIDVPGQGVVMLHQRSRVAEVQITQGGYGGGNCGSGIVQTSITTGVDQGNRASVDLGGMVLAVDMAVDPEGQLLAVVAPGNYGSSEQVQVFSLTGSTGIAAFASAPSASAAATPAGGTDAAVPLPPNPLLPGGGQCLFPDRTVEQPEGQATAVAFASAHMLAIQEREPAAISFIDLRTGRRRARLDLQQASRFETGHAMFHHAAGAGIACASCHAEGGDDSHVWSFHGIGARRTQNLRGGILGTEPFHWNGDMKDFPTLVSEVFVGRMGGFAPEREQTAALAHWIDEQPELRVEPRDSLAVQRGKQLFESEAVGCASCHNGALFTNNESADVGTGAKLQVPALRGLSLRGPWMHNGCAKTLHDRFGPCGGGDLHGRTSHLGQPEVSDLVAYLETL